MIDTGSESNVMQKIIFEKLKVSYKNGFPLKMIGAGGARFETNKYINENILIDNEIFHTKIHIVNDGDIYDEMIIGMELLNEHTVIFDRGGISIIKKVDVNENKEEKNEHVEKLMNIMIDNWEDEIPEKVKHMIANHKPKKSKETAVSRY